MAKVLLASIGALCVAFSALVACGDDDEEAKPPLTIALTIEGAGSIRSTPAGLDCTGPRDCGSHAFATDRVALDFQTGAELSLTRWTVDGVAQDIEPTLEVTGTPGSTRRVVVTFTPRGSVGGDAGGGDAGGGDGGGPSGTTCGDATCAEGEVCCATSAQFTCRPTCGVAEVTAQCSTADGCAAGEVCCLRVSLQAAAVYRPTSIQCETTCFNSSDSEMVRRLCESSEDPQCGGTCTELDTTSEFKVCEGPVR